MADARLQIIIDAEDKASKKIRSVEENLNRFGAQARQVGIAMSLLGGAALAGMTLAIKSTADGQKALEDLAATTGKLKDTIGQALVPVIVELNTVLQPVVAKFIEFTREHPRLVQGMMLAAIAVAALGTTLVVLGTGLRAAVAAFGVLSAILPMISGLVNTLTGGMVVLRTTSLTAWAAMAAPVVAFAAVLLLAQHALVELQKSFGLVPQNAKSELDKLGGLISRLVDDMVGALIPATAKFGAEFKGATADAADGVQAVIDKILKLRDAEEKVAEVARDVGAHWVSLGAETEDFLERIAGPQIDAAIAKLIEGGLSFQSAWNVALIQVARELETFMEKAAAGTSQGTAIMEAFRRGAISMAEAWKVLGATIDEATAKVNNFNMVAFASEAAAETSAIMRGMETIFGSLAETFAQRMPGGTEQLQAFRAGARSPELEEFIRLVAQITRIYLGQDPTYRAAPGQNWLNIQIDGRTIASILGGQAAVAENVRSS